MGVWIRFFIGTPKRFTVTMLCIGLVVVMINPSILVHAINSLVTGLSPLLGPVLAILIVFAGIRLILGGRK